MVPFDPKIERTARQLKHARGEREEQEAAMKNDGQNRQRLVIDDFIFDNEADTYDAPIVELPVTCHNFELKPALINMIAQKQFGASSLEDPNSHITTFL